MANKTTKLDNMTAVKDFLVLNNADETLITFVNGEIALLEKKKASRKPSKTQEENMLVKVDICKALQNGEKMRASEVASKVGISPNKASALLRQLVQDNMVERIEEKRVAYFKIAPDAFSTEDDLEN